MKMHLLAACTFICIIFSAEALTSCYYCSRTKYTKGQTTTNSALADMITRMESTNIDGENCRLDGDDYLKTTTKQNISCTTACTKYKATVSFTMADEELSYETELRTCKASDNTEADNQCSTSSDYYMNFAKSNFMSSASSNGLTFDANTLSMNGDICYCTTDNCNGGSSTTISFLSMGLLMMITKFICCTM